MILHHHDLEIDLPDAWWAEAGMAGFTTASPAYRPEISAAKGKPIFEVRIDEIGPVRRRPGIGIFSGNEQKTARERVICIFAGFRKGALIPPIELVGAPPGHPHGDRDANG
jgi:hypothetical protein